MGTFFTKYKHDPLSWLGIGFFIISFFFIAKQVESLGLVLVMNSLPNALFYFLFVLIFLSWLFYFWHTSSAFLPSLPFLTRSLTLFLPGTIILLCGVAASDQFHFLFQLGSGLLLILSLALIFYNYIQKQPKPTEEGLTLRKWFQKQGFTSIMLVIFFTALFCSFATYRLGQYAAVDEPLWLYGRITKFWNNVHEQEWEKTDVSDKPGITVAIISGVGLLRYDPAEFDDKRSKGEVFVHKDTAGMESFFFTFRFPLVVVLTLLLPLIYFFLERLLAKKEALFAYAFLTTSPILIGIAKIINPDALLWLFTTLSLLSYLVFQKRNWYRYLVFSGLFLGLALLTKYIANIVFIYLLALLFLEYLYHPPLQTRKSLPQYIRSSFINIGLVVFTALSTFYLLLPANWPEPQELIRATIFSEAFVKVLPLFATIVAVLLLDQIFAKNKFTGLFLTSLSTFKEYLSRGVVVLFLGASSFTLVNTWSGMSIYDFMELIASPKTIERRSDTIGIFLTNFYPLLFSLTPLALFGLMVALFFIGKKKFYENDGLRFAFYALIFTLVYYLGATVNGVGSIIRYQIIIFPLIAIVSGIGLATLVHLAKDALPKQKYLLYPLSLVVLGGTSIFTLATTPFPLSYASSFLPTRYYVDLKDMGPGSYEIASLLNQLPDAENILIWTDKDGVCQFFIGRCKRGNGEESLADKTLDYIVVSSARESRTRGMILNRYDDDNLDDIVPVHLYYKKENPDFEIKINDRPSHYVRAYHYEQGELLQK